MHPYLFRPALATAVACAVVLSGAASPALAIDAPAFDTRSPISGERQPFIIGYVEAPLASYRGENPQLAAPPRVPDDRGTLRLDLGSDQARQYVQHLRQIQGQREAQIEAALNRTVEASLQWQHAYNGVVLQLTPAEAVAVSRLPGVRQVEPYRERELHTDAGPRLIGAPVVWNFSDGPLPDDMFSSSFEEGEMPPAEGMGHRGEGIVVGIIDSGVNLDSPSFAAVDGRGYAHQNPFGAGEYIGQCRGGQVDEGACNDKLIGLYDFVYQVVCDPANPTTDPCRASGGSIIEEPSGDDSNGHGSHTAGTAAGNRVEVTVNGVELEISGVAPRANIISYDVCYTEVGTGRGLCPNVSSVAAINQAVADGVVDVINFSIGGGQSPWTEAESLAFLSAADAGIFVSASAGNSGPGAGTLSHVEPWVSSVGASTHDREGLPFRLSVTGPGEPPAAVRDIDILLGTAGTVFDTNLPGDTPLVVSPGIDTTDDGCNPYPAGTFDGAIALIRRGTCGFSQKAANAADAGALLVVIGNNAAGGIIPGGGGAPIPVFGMRQADANAIRDFATGAEGPLSAEIPFPARVVQGVADVMADFSSRGPSGFDLVKPDVTAPGVAILAPYAGPADSIDFLQGTSMAAPHNAGAAALLRDINPFWSPAQIKSALMLTAKSELLKEDGSTPSDAWDRGAGRIRVDLAARAGLVLDETGLNFQNANPANGGDPSALNLASMADASCVNSCSFTRRLQNPRSVASTWEIELQGLDGSLSTTSFTVPARGTRSLSVEIDSTGLPPDGSWHFGSVVLRQTDGVSPVLSMPIAVSVPAPDIELSSDSGALSLAPDDTGSVPLTVSNTAGGTLSFDASGTGALEFNLLNQLDFSSGTGIRSGFYSDMGIGVYIAEDLEVGSPLRLSQIVADGFIPSGAGLADATQITWTLYADSNGQPAGYPTDGVSLPVWTYSSAPNGPGISLIGGLFVLDLTAAGETVSLAPGTYWLIAQVDSLFADSWFWYVSSNGVGEDAQVIVAPDTAPAWGSTGTGFSMLVTAEIDCGAPWITGTTPATGNIGPLGNTVLSVDIDSTGLTDGLYQGYVCIQSNDADEPTVPFRVDLTVATP